MVQAASNPGGGARRYHRILAAILDAFITMFLDDAPTKLAAIQAGSGEGDFEKIERAAHSLKGSAGNLGAGLVQADCEALQVAGRQHEMSTVQATLPELISHFEDAARALSEIRARYEP